MQTGIKNLLKIAIIIAILFNIQIGSYAQKIVSDKTVYSLVVHYKDSLNSPLPVVLKNSFADLPQVYSYINGLPKLFSAKGYPVASVDSVWEVNNKVNIILYVGKKYSWIQLRTNNIDKNLLSSIGYNSKNFSLKPLNIVELDMLKERILSYYENQGFPFAMVYLDSVNINDDKIAAVLMVNTGLLYRIDSINNYGKLKLNQKFLQRYLNITNGSIYSREKLREVDKKMLELQFAQTVQSSTITMLGYGSILNLYVNDKKSSEASAIFGFLPNANNTGKLQVTGDVNLDLKNVFGAGEGLIIKYQALQPKSPRLNLGYEKPYVLNSNFGSSFLFELFKKDSSFLQVNAQLGLLLNLNNKQAGKVFVQWQATNLLLGGIDTNIIKIEKKLPANIDFGTVNAGITYEFRNTNYRYNPLTGNELIITALAGIKTIKKNNDIVSLKTTGFNYESLYDSVKLKSYQLRLKISGAHFFKVSNLGTIKTALSAGIYGSPNVFRNEVFQIGGNRLLRGFDEESIYANRYAVFTGEYRAIISLNSYAFSFIDAAITGAKYQAINAKNVFTSIGLGIVLERKVGLLNLSLAIGKRNDVPFNIRQAAKIHFGYVNYF